MTVEKVRAIRTEGLIGVMVTLDYEALRARLHDLDRRAAATEGAGRARFDFSR